MEPFNNYISIDNVFKNILYFSRQTTIIKLLVLVLAVIRKESVVVIMVYENTLLKILNSFYIRVPAFGYDQPVRVCNPCFALVDEMFIQSETPT